MVKNRKLTSKDWENVATYIKDSLKERESSKYRSRAQKIWKEVDRQVCLEPLQRVKKDPNANGDWRNAVELGELSRASEILSADIRRLTFPQARAWMEAHSEIQGDINQETGEVDKDKNLQKRVDGQVRALMSQQHVDFGLKARVDLSVKEALHHGSYVVEVEWDNFLKVHDGSGVESISAPVWVPHSMWNCYPENSKAVLGANMFYPGSMIIREWMPYHKVKDLTGEGYMSSQIKKIKKQKDEVELLKYYGDIVIQRNDGDIYLPNSKAIVAGDVLIYWKPNDLPFNPIIYNGWERLDVRDPYYISPIVKMSPNQKIASILANKFLDGIDLKTEPPVGYDGTDPDFVMNGGPDLSPGAKFPSKGNQNYHVFNDIGEPESALKGLMFHLGEMQKGTSVDAIRSGVSKGTEQTATETVKQSQAAEVREVDFVDKHEMHGLRPFLYMQHILNKKNLSSYSFYNPEMDAPDFERLSKDDLPGNVHFEIVGSKGLLGEEQRQQKTMAWTSFLLSNPMTANIVNIVEIAKQGYMDAGNKNPERFLKVEDDEEMMKQQYEQQIQQIVQEAQAQIDELQKDVSSLEIENEAHQIDMSGEQVKQDTLRNKISQLQIVIEFLRQKRGSENDGD